MKLLAVDSNSLVNRAYFGVRPLSAKDGTPTNAIYGFLSMLDKITTEENPDALAFAFDLKAPTFRHKMYSGYKAGRHAMPNELFLQLAPLKEILGYMGYRVVTKEGYEADDILGTLGQKCRENNWECVIATGDRDSFQLVGNGVKVHLASTKMGQPHSETVDEKYLLEKYNLTPSQMIELKALMGDSSDNIPGVMGVGEKTALSLLDKYKTVDGVYEHVNEITGSLHDKLVNGKDSAYLSKALGTICLEAPIDEKLSDFIKKPRDENALYNILYRLDLNSFIKKYDLHGEIIKDKKPQVQVEDPELLDYVNGNMWLYENIEFPLKTVLSDMEQTGFSVDKDGIINFGKELEEDIKVSLGRIYFYAGTEFNVNSPKQLGDILFNQLGLEGGKKNKTGFSTDADTLEKLARQNPIVEEVLQYRKLAKLKSTYVDGLIDKICEDGKLHTHFKQTETRTGRLSSAEPNLQNIPVRTERGSTMRKFFVASPGKILVDADYSQIELRVLAYMAQDKNMLDAFASGEDIHKQTAAKIFNMPIDFVTPQMRSAAKAVNFGIVYGISAFGLANDIGVSNKEAKEYIDSYNDTYSGITTYMENIIKDAKEQGYVETLFGRRRYIPELSQGKTRAFGERIARNTPIQGTAADIIKLAMIKVYNRLKEEKLDAKLILQVHDELIVECDPSCAEKVAELLKFEMENVIADKYIFKADVHIGQSWLEAKG